MKIKWFPHKNDFPIDKSQLTDVYYATKIFPIILGMCLIFFLAIGVEVLQKDFFDASHILIYILWLILAFMVLAFIVWVIYTRGAIMIGLTTNEMYIFLSGLGYCKCPWNAIERTEIVTIKSGFGKHRKVERDLFIYIKPEYRDQVIPRSYWAHKMSDHYKRDMNNVIILHDISVPIDKLQKNIDQRIKENT